MTESPVLLGWPYAGLILGAALVLALLLEKRRPDAPPRSRDPVFLLPLLWPMYLVHQFEEHGIDARGRHFAFLGDLCAAVGHAGDLAGCPGDATFVFVVNVIACPLAFVMPLLFRRTNPALALFGWSVPLVNGVTHVASAIMHHAYNAGLLTSLLLFLPLGAWVVRASLRARIVTARQVPLVLLSGVLLHAVLVGSLLLHEHGMLSRGALLAVNGINGLVPWLVGWLATRSTPRLHRE